MLTEQDRVNLSFAKEWFEKADKKKGIKSKRLKGVVGWVGKVGFDECVAHLSGKEGITNPTLVCGALKGRARKTGVLSRTHMGRLEKKRKKGKK